MAAFAVLRLGRLSKRPELTTPVFLFLLTAGGGIYAPLGEGGFGIRNHYRQAAVETPLA